jgi:hypothetical protein
MRGSYSTQIIPSIARYFRSEKPSTIISSSGRLKRRCCVRYSIIRLAITSPIPGRVTNSSELAVLIFKQVAFTCRSMVDPASRVFESAAELTLVVEPPAALHVVKIDVPRIRRSSSLRLLGRRVYTMAGRNAFIYVAHGSCGHWIDRKKSSRNIRPILHVIRGGTRRLPGRCEARDAKSSGARAEGRVCLVQRAQFRTPHL